MHPDDDAVPVFESWIDRQVRLAVERGDFDNLPGKGKPVDLGQPGRERPWIVDRLSREDLSSILPTPLLLRKETENLATQLESVKTEQAAREIIQNLNQRIKESNLSPTTPRIITALVDEEATIRAWRRQR